MENKVIIVDYLPEHQPAFERLNRAWIEKYFAIEPIDQQVLTQPDIHLIHPGGCIIMAKYEGVLVGTVALKKEDSKCFEMTKMAVDEKYRGKGIGELLANAILHKAKVLGADKVILYSQTQLAPAISLYRKIGFKEIPLECGKYSRCNIKMEISL